MMTKVLALVNPLAFGRTERVKRVMQHLAKTLKVENVWQFEVAALLSQLGCIALPESLLSKVVSGADLNDDERTTLDSHPKIGADLIRDIPRLAGVAEIIAYQEKHFDGSGPPNDDKRGDDIPLGARALRASVDFDSMQARSHSTTNAIARMKSRVGWYDPAVLTALERIPPDWAGYVHEVLSVRSMRAGMIVNEDVQMPNGLVLARRGFELNDFALMRLSDCFDRGLIHDHFEVLVPPER